MSSSYIHTADPTAAASTPATATASTAASAQQLNTIAQGSQTNVKHESPQLPHVTTNTKSFSHNAALSNANASFGDLSSVSQFPISAQEILKRATENANVVSGSPAWEAARQQVMKSMAGGSQTLPPLPPVRGRGRGRPPSKHTTIRVQAAVQAAAVPKVTVTTNGDASGTTTPTKRGRGRGRVRGSRGSTRGRGGKRKREDDTEGSPSEVGLVHAGLKTHCCLWTLTLFFLPEQDEDSEISDSYTPLATVTKSGRNITKPLQFNPATEMSSDGEPKRRRPYRRGPEFTLCVKCERGHSPLSNAIVFCDGCNSAYHQWCHDPHIPREVIEITEKEWFCGKCVHKKEMERLPMGKRVSGEGLSADEVIIELGLWIVEFVN